MCVQSSGAFVAFENEGKVDLPNNFIYLGGTDLIEIIDKVHLRRSIDHGN